MPVFADVDETYNIDPKDVEAKITSRTRAIMAVHLFGNPCDMTTLREIADRHNIFLIEDCCQAHFADAVKAEGVPAGGPYLLTPEIGPLYRNPFLADTQLYGNSRFPLDYERERPVDYRLVECPYGEELMSRTVNLPMIPNFTEEDVGDIIQAFRKVADAYRK